MIITVSIKGGPELAAKLKKLSDNVAGKALENAVVSGALLIQNAAKKKAPVQTGNLRRSLHIGGYTEKSDIGKGAETGLIEIKTKTGKSFKRKRYKGTTGTDVGGNKSSRNSAEVLVGTNVEYAAMLEFGISKMTPRPYLRPALDEKANAVAKEIGKALKILLGKI